MKPLIFDIKRYAVNDGQGIRITIFLKGCPLSCKWCHNPESISPKAQKLYDINKCMACNLCVEACKLNACILTKKGIVTDNNICQVCGKCEDACPTKATEISGKLISENELMETIKKETLLMDKSDGGVTFSGGEPLMHHNFLLDILKKCGKEGIHRCIDTTGFANTNSLLEIAKETDCFLYDLKIMDSSKHKTYTGVHNDIILSNLQELAKTKVDINIRIPLIKNINDELKNIHKTAEFISNLENKAIDVSILPYHNIAKKKYEKLGNTYQEETMLEPNNKKINEVIEIFKSYNIIAAKG